MLTLGLAGCARLLDNTCLSYLTVDELGDVQAAIDDNVCDLRVLLEWVEREEKEGIGEAPYPPDFPKMPGEPRRVQPSRRKRA